MTKAAEAPRGMPRSALIASMVLAVVFVTALAYYDAERESARYVDQVKRDIEKKPRKPFHYFAVGINLLVPLLGLLVYILVRPGTTLAEDRAMAMEAEALSQSTAEADDVRFSGNAVKPFASALLVCTDVALTAPPK